MLTSNLFALSQRFIIRQAGKTRRIGAGAIETG